MKKYLLFLFLPPLFIQAQDCPAPRAAQLFHANEIQTYVKNGGDLFWNPNNYRPHFKVPFAGNDTPSSIFLADFIMGGLVEEERRVAFNRYRSSTHNNDYAMGSLHPETGMVDTLTCQQFDKIWTVARYEIELFLADLADNGQINDPIDNIMGYPAKGNPYFEIVNDFDLPEREQGFAPFFDVNGDGLYRPEEGDYPHPPHVHPSAHPEQMTWCVFNDTRAGFSDEPLHIEVQLTTYAFSCEDNEILNHSIFTNYQLWNASEINIDSFHAGWFTDIHLGCSADDRIASYPAANSIYTYNADLLDGTSGNFCPNNTLSYPWNVPVQAMTVLDHSLDYFIYSADNAFGTPPAGRTDPSNSIELFHYLSGNFRTGEPLEYGGDGYQSGSATTAYAFPDNPNNPDGWSMHTHSQHVSSDYDYRGFSTSHMGDFPPNAVLSLDYAWSFHHHPDSNHLQNVNVMYENLPVLQSMYNNGFINICQQEVVCETDCIWTGDTNADGITNHQDLLPIAVALTMSGPTRSAPYNWSPRPNSDWTNTFPDGNINYKHIDANGDGLILKEDFEMTQVYYDFTRPDYVVEDVYTDGTDLFLEVTEGINIDSIDQLTVIFNIRLADVSDLYGLAFTIEYDERYIAECQIIGQNDWNYEYQKMGETDYVQSKINGVDILNDEDMPQLSIRFPTSFSEPLPSATTLLRFKNIKANDRIGNPIELGAQDLALTLVDVPVDNKEIANTTFKIYPNPVLDKMYIKMPQNVDKTKLINIKVWNTVGKLVFSTKMSAAEMILDAAFLEAGLYFLTVEQGDFIRTRKFVKD